MPRWWSPDRLMQWLIAAWVPLMGSAFVQSAAIALAKAASSPFAEAGAGKYAGAHGNPPKGCGEKTGRWGRNGRDGTEQTG